MTDSGTRAMIDALGQKVSLVTGIIALLGVLVFIIGLFVGSPLVRIICAVVLVGMSTGVLLWWRMSGQTTLLRTESGKRPKFHSQTPDATMKKLLFDDFQSFSGKYVVKEVSEDDAIVPSTKSARPVVIQTREEKVRDFELSDYFELDAETFHSDAEPRSEFNFLLSKVLLALKEVFFAHSVAFFWANRDKGEMVLETVATGSQNFMTSKRFPIEDDIVSQVAKSGKPQVLGSVNPVSEKELVTYYQSPESIRSLVVVPVYFLNGSHDRVPVGVIVVDSKAEDAFGYETLGILRNFTKLVSALVKTYTDKYDLLLDSELLSSIRRIQDRIKSDPSEHTILTSLAEEANRLVNWDYLTVSMYSEEHQAWVLQEVVNKVGDTYVNTDQQIDFDRSIVGQAIRANQVLVLEDLNDAESSLFHSDENVHSSGSLVAIPISSVDRCYGAVTLQSRYKKNFSGKEVETVYRLVENVATLLEVIYMNDLVKDFVTIDQLSGSFTRKHFAKRLDEEIQRADDSGTELALVSFAVDDMEDHIHRYGREAFDSIVRHVAKIIRSNLRPYDVIGRQEADRLGVLLVNTPASDAYLWAEKVRKVIASHVVTLGGKSFSVTVSAGVSGLIEGMHTDQLIAGTTQVLRKAIEDGGNLVQVYN